MAKKLTVSTGEWAKHLRPAGKREFWKKERKAGKATATPDRVCTNCGQWVWSGRCLNDCQAHGFDVAPVVRAYGLEAEGHYGPSGTHVLCAACFVTPDFPVTVIPLTQTLCDLNRDAMRDSFLCDRCGVVLSAMETK